jgi:hypothetical protein
MTVEKYPVPAVDPAFDAPYQASVRLKEANAFITATIEHWKKCYHGFWMPPRIYKKRAFTAAELQAMINTDPATLGNMLSDSKAFIDFVEANYPELVGDEEGKPLPTRYLNSPYELDGLTVGALRPEWEEQEEGEE